MHFPLKFVDHPPVTRMHDVVTHLFAKIEGAKHFKKTLIPKWLWPTYDNDSVLTDHFGNVFTSYKALPPSDRKFIRAAVDNNNKIEQLCRNKNFVLKNIKQRCPRFHRYLKALSGYLFSDVLGPDKEIKKHYKKFITQNDDVVVCPFCGIEQYEDIDGGVRTAYDHYLPKSKYPLAAINFKNLVPLCNCCNRSPAKGMKDLIHFDTKQKKRRYAIYPYALDVEVSLVLALQKAGTVKRGAVWAISMAPEPNTSLTCEKVEAWIAVFDLNRRYGARINSKSRVWINGFLQQHKEITSKTSLKSLRNKLKKHASQFDNPVCRKLESEAVLKQAYYRYLAVSAPDSELMGIIGAKPW